MLWKITDSAFGWKAAHDDDKDLLVVWHSKLRRHYSGADAWKQAVLLSIRPPSAHPLLRREGRP
ncbi:hypothetical protein EZH22_29190 [Xanthobacter dioxanivorans]|uniref:Uncharacterized protein n=1 Tax=Xanthobacter dioxanivorans TaxID=2528964 RepID=A0A974PNK0_9HYPH|nr:hypothetical protein [Xanthobacter dioxanivorans]QRG06869.1 hypothetical protein EZH22_29190 [Xanthobacter dioxanivorans]